jgi:hypothetical protein
VVTQPADVVKTKLMTGPAARAGEEQSSIPSVVRRIFEAEGFAGFFSGLRERLYIVAFGGAVYFGASSAAAAWLAL